MENKQVTITWLNVTTFTNWKGNPVGIVRTEMELIRYLLKSNNPHVKFCIYESKSRLFREVEAFKLNILLKDYLTNKKIKKDFLNILLSFIRINWKEKFKNKVLNIIPSLPFYIGKIFWYFSLVFFRISRFLYRIFRYIYLKNRSKFTNISNFINRFQLENKLKPKKYMLFKKNDVFISVGMDWNLADFLPTLYKLKKLHLFKVVLFCYDIIPIKLPHLCLFNVANSFSLYFCNLAWVADRVLSISQNSQNDLATFLNEIGTPVPKLSTIELGDNIDYKTGKKKEISDAVTDLLKKKYLLCVCSIESRKNHELLYKIYSRLSVVGYKNLPILVLVGFNGWGVNDLIDKIQKDPFTQNKIKILHDLTDYELGLLYKNCLFTLFPSLYEGWGLPVRESLAWGKFCLSSNSSSLPEAGKNFVEYLDPIDTMEWMRKIKFFLENPEKVKEKEEYIRKNFKPRSWHQFGEDLFKSIQDEN